MTFNGRTGQAVQPRSRCVYYVCMARVNVYLPDELAEAARAAGLNVSSLTQEVLRERLAARRTSEWLDRVRRLPPSEVTHEQVMEALREARDEFGERGG
jgi:post-segregation antitoxin (ccd killing protein)